MLRHVKPFVARHEPRPASHLATIKGALGGVAGMSAVGFLATATGLPLLIAPFGATSVLLYGHPASPLAQPANVIGGYCIATLIALGVFAVLPHAALGAAISVGLAMAAMTLLRVTHPPAGAVPVLLLSGNIKAATFALTIGLGSAALIAVAALVHRLPPRHAFPKPRATTP